MTKKFMFEFGHFDEKNDTETITNYLFDFIDMTDEEIQTLYDKSMDGFAYEKFVGEMEEYGIHDFFGTDEILHGFDSSEIDPKRYLSVVKKWQRYFTNVVGLKTGPIYKIDGKIEYL